MPKTCCTRALKTVSIWGASSSASRAPPTCSNRSEDRSQSVYSASESQSGTSGGLSDVTVTPSL